MGGEKSSPEAAVQSGAKPRTRQRVYKAPPALDVPDIEDDAAERKRVLNVLAQRRYSMRVCGTWIATSGLTRLRRKEAATPARQG